MRILSHNDWRDRPGPFSGAGCSTFLTAYALALPWLVRHVALRADLGSEIAHRHISDNGAREKLLFEEVKRAAVGLAS